MAEKTRWLSPKALAEARISLDGRDLGDDLIAAGHARAYDGGQRGA